MDTAFPIAEAGVEIEHTVENHALFFSPKLDKGGESNCLNQARMHIRILSKEFL